MMRSARSEIPIADKEILFRNSRDGKWHIGYFDGRFWFARHHGEVEWEVRDWLYLSDISNAPIQHLITLVQDWAHDRNLIKGSTPAAQYLKLISEAGELADNIAKGREIVDDVGDMLVVLIIIASQSGITLQQCLAHAYEEIKDRKGTMINGVFVKEE